MANATFVIDLAMIDEQDDHRQRKKSTDRYKTRYSGLLDLHNLREKNRYYGIVMVLSQETYNVSG